MQNKNKMVLDKLFYATEFSLRSVSIDLSNCGRLSFKTKLFRLFSTLLHLSCIIPGVLYLTNEKQTFASVTEEMTNIVLHITSLVNFYYFFINSEKVSKLYNLMKSVIKLESTSKIFKKSASFNKDINIIRVFIWAFLVGASVACSNQAVFFMYKYFTTGERLLIFNAWLPYDSKKSPWYEITFLVQAVAMQNIGLAHFFVDAYYMTIVGLYVSSVKFLRKEVEEIFYITLNQEDSSFGRDYHLIHQKIEEESEKDEGFEDKLNFQLANSKQFRAKFERNFIEIIKRHQTYLDIANEIKDLFWPILLYDLLTNLFYVVSIPLLILTYWPHNVQKIVIMVERTTTSMWQLLIITVIAQALTDESLRFKRAIYFCPWYIFRAKTQKMFLTVLTKSGKLTYITAGQYINITLETFLSIVNLAYSLFTVLNSFIKTEE